jgi:phage shock protein PspC (stress-responsive transcriptional regulator)
MKKIININLSGRVIPIEDSAYEKLQSYIESLRRYFSKEQDRDEIINDIESRIAELMNEKIRKGATHITDSDIDEIAASMGRPEDFESDATTSTTGASTQTSAQETYAEKKTRSRLYRDVNDKFIGGVCSGIAAYLNIDPSIIRILFAIITFGGFGLGFLIYIILWIVLPPRDEVGYVGKRLYRNPDDKVLGGVAGGLAAYFGREKWVIRVIFAAPFIFSGSLSIIRAFTWGFGFDPFPNLLFGSLSGTFALAYVILWAVLPVAKSPHEKMEMRGEKVDVNTIRQDVKERVKEWSDEVKTSAQNIAGKAKEFANTKGKSFASEVNESTRRRGSGIGHAIGVVFKAFFLFIAGTIAFGLFVALMALLIGGVAWWPINDFLWTSNWQQAYALGTLILFLGVPLIGFIVWVVRRIINARSRSSYLGWTFGFLWTLGWISVILFVVSVTRDMSDFEQAPDQTIQVTQPANGRMIVAVTQPEIEYTGDYDWLNDEAEGFDLNSDTMKLAFVDFKIEKSLDTQYHVAVQKWSFGRTSEEARNRAQSFEYNVVSRDSILDLSSGYAISRNNKFRFQRVLVVIQVPVGKKIRFDQTVKTKLNAASIRSRNERRRDLDFVFNDNAYYWWRANTDYTMQEDNQLKDENGAKISTDRRNDRHDWYNDNNNNNNHNRDDYRYEKRPGTSSEVNDQLEEQKRLKRDIEIRDSLNRRDLMENERKIKELEQKQKGTQAPSAKSKNTTKGNCDLAKNSSHVLSLADTFF